jgi:hypothetical protein
VAAQAVQSAVPLSLRPSIRSSQARELDVRRVNPIALLVDKPGSPSLFPRADVDPLCPRPRVLQARCASDNHVERRADLMGAPDEIVERVLIAMDPRCGELFVEESPTESNGSVEATVLVEGEEGLGIRLQPAPEFRVIPVAQVSPVARRRLQRDG